jgi:hypothetical protein
MPATVFTVVNVLRDYHWIAVAPTSILTRMQLASAHQLVALHGDDDVE